MKTTLNGLKGFRRKRGTKDNLIYMTQKITQAFHSKLKICAIYFDIQSAFDKVWHTGLISQIIKMNFPSYLILWLNNFLENCKNRVSPVLSPTLFSIYINDIPQNQDDQSKSLLFADDLIFMFQFKDINFESESHLNKYLSKITQWSSK